MDGRQFDELMLSLSENRRSLLGAMLAGALGLLALGDSEVAGKGKKKKKKKKKKGKGNGDQSCAEGRTAGGKATPICTPPPPSDHVCNFYDGLVQCEGEAPGVCCDISAPKCGGLTVPGSINHLCCLTNERWCEPVEGKPTYGICAPLNKNCCTKLSHSGLLGSCPPIQTCCRGRRDTNPNGACCDHECCESDAECPTARSKCDNFGCCVEDCAKNGESCVVDQDCCEDEDSCESGICKRHRGDVCDNTIVCSERYPHCVAFCEGCLGTCQRCPANQVSTGTDEICCPPNRHCNNANGGRGACCQNDGCCLEDEDGDPCGLTEYMGEGQCG